MAIEIPKIEERDFDDLLREFKALVPFYTPEWRLELNEKGSDIAIVKIFIHLLRTVYHRLNRLPEKHFIAFLDKIGIKLIPAQPSIVPVTFLLSEGAGEHVLVPERTQVAAGDVNFETEKNLLAAPARLVDIYSIDGPGDAIFQSPPNIIAGEPVLPVETWLAYPVEPGDREIFIESSDDLREGDGLLLGNIEYAVIASLSDTVLTLIGGAEMSHGVKTAVQKVTSHRLFTGKSLQEHTLYLGDNTLFDITDTVRINLTIGDRFSGSTGMTWHYYGEDSTGAADWHPLEVSSGEDVVVLSKKETGEIMEIEVNARSSCWLRCQVHPSEISAWHDVTADSIKVEVLPLEEEKPADFDILPDLIYYNDVPVDPAEISGNKPLYPFGKQPVLHSTFYLASQRVFSKKGAVIAVYIDFSPPGFPGENGVDISWEYWDGEGWCAVKNLEDSTSHFRKNGKVKFTCPDDMAPIEVSGKENYWLMARLISGDYGREKFVKEAGSDIWKPDYSDVRPPAIFRLSLSYTHEYSAQSYPLQYCLTYNNLEFIDRSREIQESGKTFNPFFPLEEEKRCLYLAFDQKLEKGPVALFFAIEESPVSPAGVPIIRWEYYGEKQQWENLDILDNTMSLTRTGVIEFVFPSDFRETGKFGVSAYWLRAVYEDRTAAGSADIAVPTLTGVFLNTTWARQYETFSDEIVGSGDGTPGQVFSLENVPVVSGSPELWIDEFETLSSEEQAWLREEETYPVNSVSDDKGDLTGFWVQWKAIDGIANASAEDRCYEIDNVSGTITFGDGTYGKIPPTGTDNIKANYRCGGGRGGNLPALVVEDLKTSLPFLDSAFNPLAAGGGTDTESIEGLMKRGPCLLKHRNRAVTVDDFEQLAFQSAGGIARVKCLANLDDRRESREGRVTVIVIPQTDEEKPRLSLQLKRKVEKYLQQRASYPLVNNDYLRVIGPVYAGVSVEAEVAAADMDDVPLVERACHTRLREFLNPLSGGYEQRGWDFGKVPCFSDFYALLEKIGDVDHVVSLSVTLDIFGPGNGEAVARYLLTPDNPEDFSMPPYAVVCSGKHKISVSI